MDNTVNEPLRGRGLVLARFSRPTGRPTTIAVIADPHVTPTDEGTWKVFQRTETRLRAAVANANRLGVDTVVSTGDLTKDGTPAEFECIDSILGELDVPFVAVPGNHDVPKEMNDHHTPPVSRFVNQYTPGSLPYVVRVGGIDLVGLNTASTLDRSLTDTNDGAIETAQLDWLDATLGECETPVVICHHPAGRITRRIDTLSPSSHYWLRNADDLVDVLVAHDVELVVSGHVHWPAVDRIEGVRQVIASATCSFPQMALLVHIEPRGTTVSLLPLADRRGLREAYQYASRGLDRGSAFIAATDNGYFTRFPQVDEADGIAMLRPRDPPQRQVRSSHRA